MNFFDLHPSAHGRFDVAVIGMGYVGIPLALTMIDKGLRVVGIDSDAEKVNAICSGRSYIKHISEQRIAAAVNSGSLCATTKMAAVQNCGAVILCLPTPLGEHRDPDMSYVRDAAQSLCSHIRPGQLIVLESTTYPGTTEELLKLELERGGLRAGEDFYLAYSPEREDPGNPSFQTKLIPKLVSGLTPRCKELAVSLYTAFLDNVVPVSSLKAAEMAKLLENIFRCVNIALVNEMKVLSHDMGVDIWEVIAAASTKPFGFMPFFPGPGLGGHCIPVDPFYLTWKAREYGLHTRFIELAGEINAAMPRYVIERLALALNREGKALRGAEILVLGVAYKKDVDDTRESPALPVMEQLQKRFAKVAYHDPHVPSLCIGGGRLYSQPAIPADLSRLDAVVIITDHSSIDYASVLQHAPLIIDTRNVTRDFQTNGAKVVHA